MSNFKKDCVTTTYTITLDTLKEIIAKEMELPVDEISVNFIQTDMADDRFDTRPRYEVTSINIIHKQK